jgi:3-isopropylmalate/(R)-2-methylmalate dehydratase small subunit
VIVSDEFLNKVFSRVEANPKTEIMVDLSDQTVTNGSDKESFEINAYKKDCLINGYDDIDYLLSLKDEIKKFEAEPA